MIKKIPAIDLMNKKVVRLYKGDKKNLLKNMETP